MLIVCQLLRTAAAAWFVAGAELARVVASLWL